MKPGPWCLLALAPALLAAADAPAHAAPDRTPACGLSRADRRATSSRECMTCHDGSAGAPIAFAMRADGRGMSHPVSMDYAAAAAAHPDQYVPEAALPAEVPLVRGRVECTTCHDGASPDPKRVVLVRDLCVACHRL